MVSGLALSFSLVYVTPIRNGKEKHVFFRMNMCGIWHWVATVHWDSKRK